MRRVAMLLVCLAIVGTVGWLGFGAGDSGRVEAQQGYTLSGVTVDPAGQAIPGVAVELRQGTAVVRNTVTDRQGQWSFASVGPGQYELRATLAGFRTSVLTVSVQSASGPPLRIVMQIGDSAETVTVGAQAARASAKVAGGIPGAAAEVVSGAASAPPATPPPVGFSAGSPAAVDSLYGRDLSHIVRPDTASYAEIEDNKFRDVLQHPLSTFSIDVDTASYANVRRFLNQGRLPPAAAVRIEELINYFKFDYAAPGGNRPVSVSTELGAAPWNPKHRLVLVGLRAASIEQEKVGPRNLTFLLDVSGSMSPDNRLPLVKRAMNMLVDTLRPEDRVGIVVYAGHSGVALKPTSGARKDVIRRAIDQLNAGGSTNGAAGIQLAYDLAAENFAKHGVNRVILATDGDFNVGVTSQAELVRLIEEKRERGIFLSVLGVGDDNLKDSTMEKLADKGNGNYSYLDSLQEGRRVLIAEANATLVTVAKDVKVQIEFNPRFVSAYRLIGYENRVLRKEDFNNDRKDAGEMGAGHTVTALYEIVPPGESIPGSVDPLKYQPQPKAAAAAPMNSPELMTVKVRYKEPQGDTSRLLEFPVHNEARMTSNLGFASAVAAYGMMLRHSEHRGSTTWTQIAALAKENRGRDEDGYRAEFIRLVDLASALDRTPTTSESTRR